MSNLTRGLLYRRNCVGSLFNKHGYCMERTFCEQPLEQSRGVVPNSKRAIWNEYFNKALKEDLKNAKPFEEIPKLPMIPFFGSSWMYFPIIGKYNSSRMHEADFHKQRTYGDIVRERFGNFEIVSCFHPVGNRILDYHEGKYPVRAEFTTIKTYREKRKRWYRTHGLFVVKGSEWDEFRKMVVPYTSQKCDYPGIRTVARDLGDLINVERDSNNEIPDLIYLLNKWALESIYKVTLGERLGCLNPYLSPKSDALKMIKSIHTQLACINKLEASSGNFPFWKYFPTPTWLRYVKAADVFSELVFRHIQNSMDNFYYYPDEMKQTTIVLRMLMDRKLSIPSIMVAVGDIIMAGIDTVSHATGYFLYLMAKNPEKQERLYEELLKRYPNKEDPFMFTHIQYYWFCHLEAMRLLPVVRGNLRVFDHDVVLQGYRIPAGTAVLCAQDVFSRDERFFDNANDFIPERYARRGTQVVVEPFGVGRRYCAGLCLARSEIFAAVAEILRNFRVECDDDIKIVTRLVNIPEKPIKMRFIPR